MEAAQNLSEDVSVDDDDRATLLEVERRALRMIADGEPLSEILDSLCKAIEAQQPEVIASVLLMDTDGKQLWPAAGPSLPADWTQAISPFQIGAENGACGTAAFRKQTVIVADIATDPEHPQTPPADLMVRKPAEGNVIRFVLSLNIEKTDGAMVPSVKKKRKQGRAYSRRLKKSRS